MDELKTEEAKLWKAMDKLDASIQHNEAEIRTWLPLEYELNPVYGDVYKRQGYLYAAL